MTKHTVFNALCYELAMWAAEKRPSLRLQPWFIALINWCRPDWAEWKTQQTLKEVDEQVVALVELWEKEEREALGAEQFSKISSSGVWAKLRLGGGTCYQK